jgi:tetratricopeptide (TPR) repeat protein
VLGEANCIKSLGDIALRRSDHEGAREHYERALPRSQRVGDVLGEANCIQSLGDIALGQSDQNRARAQYEDALALYARIPDPYSIGSVHVSLTRVASDESERRRHLQAAREAWLSIKRDDLVRGLDETGGEG